MFTIGNLYFLPVDKTYATFGKPLASQKYVACMLNGEVLVHNILTEEEILKTYPNAKKVTSLKDAVELGFKGF